MFKLRGKCNEAVIYTENADQETISQVQKLLNQESCKDSRIRIMPDCHAGAGCVIGTTMTIRDKVIPGLVGVDIGCGMLTMKLAEHEIDFQKLDEIIRKYIPAGHNIHETVSFSLPVSAEDLSCFKKGDCKVSAEIFEKSAGTLGGGNHFIEVDRDDGTLYLVIHTGSRRSGKDVAEYYQNAAFNALNMTGAAKKEEEEKQRAEFIKKMKAEGRQKEISRALKTWTPDIKNKGKQIPLEFAYCEGDLFRDYIHDMEIMQRYASFNRKRIADTIIEKMDFHVTDQFETIHNYIDMENMILRKGSISAKEGEIILIPMNMRDGSMICRGKGNPEWNCSAPHGAGRLMSRSAAKKNISLEEYQEAMNGIFTTSVSMSTIDESPMAYKPMDEIIKNIHDTAEILKVIKPVYNFKAGE